jgi:hypothetical protein
VSPHTSGKEDGITIYVFLLETDIPTSGFGSSANGQSESERERERVITYKNVGSKSMFN